MGLYMRSGLVPGTRGVVIAMIPHPMKLAVVSASTCGSQGKGRGGRAVPREWAGSRAKLECRGGN